MNVSPDKKIYFLSDFHLGAPDATSSLVREKKAFSELEIIADATIKTIIITPQTNAVAISAVVRLCLKIVKISKN